MYDKAAEWVAMVIRRWMAKSPKVYRIITDVFLGIGIAGSIIPLIPDIFKGYKLPAWVIPVAALVVVIASKMTVKEKTDLKTGKKDEMD